MVRREKEKIKKFVFTSCYSWGVCCLLSVVWCCSSICMFKCARSWSRVSAPTIEEHKHKEYIIIRRTVWNERKLRSVVPSVKGREADDDIKIKLCNYCCEITNCSNCIQAGFRSTKNVGGRRKKKARKEQKTINTSWLVLPCAGTVSAAITTLRPWSLCPSHVLRLLRSRNITTRNE